MIFKNTYVGIHHIKIILLYIFFIHTIRAKSQINVLTDTFGLFSGDIKLCLSLSYTNQNTSWVEWFKIHIITVSHNMNMHINYY